MTKFFSALHPIVQKVKSRHQPVVQARKAEPIIEPGLAFQAAQIETLYATLPLFALSHIIAVAVFARLADAELHSPLGGLWFNGSLGPLALLVLFWVGRRQRAAAQPYSRRDKIEACLLALVFSFIWAACPVIFFPTAGQALRILLVGLVMSAAAAGTFAFSRLPSAAIIYAGVTTASLAVSGLLLHGSVGLVFAFATVTFGFVLSSLVLNLHRDQIERYEADLARRRDNDLIEARAADYQDLSGEMFWECDADGRLNYISPRLAISLVRPRQLLVGRSIIEVLGLPSAGRAFHILNDALTHPKPEFAVDLELPLSKEPVVWHFKAKAKSGANGAFLGYRGICRDVTIDRSAEGRIAMAEAVAEAANNARTRFLSVISHELRTPLNSIVGFSEILAARSGDALDPSLVSDYCATILESSRHLQSLISDVLDASRIDNGDLTLAEDVLDAAEVVEIAVKTCQDQAEQADVILLAKLVNDVEIQADPARMKQVVLNMIINAIRFSPSGAIVNISMAKTADDGLVLLVRDGGIGVRPEDVERIFDPFIEDDSNIAHGFAVIGLGLSVARKIARLHGGDVTLESQFGSGTTLRFSLPASRVRWLSYGRAAPVVSAA